MEHYKFEISQFCDGELEEKETSQLFGHLAGCPECRKVFNEYLFIKEKAKDFCAGKISDSIKNTIPGKDVPADGRHNLKEGKRKGLFYKTGFYISAAAAIILLFINLNTKKETVFMTKNEIKKDTVFIPKEKKIIKYVKVNQSPEMNNRKYLEYVNTIPAASTKNYYN